jgi:prophage antirepressor-like protein
MNNSTTTALAAVTPPAGTFRFPVTGHTIRTVLISNQPWFVATDVAAILALGNVHSSLALLDDDERELHTLETLGGPQQVAVVSEPGLYALILRSRKPEAKAFRRWIVHEVLPAIHRTGSYAIGKLTPRQLAQLVIAEADRADVAEQRIAELEPAAGAWETLATADGDYSLRDAAHILNRDPALSTGQNRLMRFLRDEGMVDRKGVPYVRYTRYLVERPVSYTHPNTGEPVLTQQIRITADGLAYLRARLGGVRHSGAVA